MRNRAKAKGGVLRQSILVLIILTGISYCTTFARERFLYQNALGSTVLDQAAVISSALALAANVCGMLLVFTWTAGRLKPRTYLALLVGAIAVDIVFLAMTPVGATIWTTILAQTLYLVCSQKAAAAGRLYIALIGAIPAPVATVSVWAIAGTHSVLTILVGYAAGSTFQAIVAFLAGIGGQPGDRAGRSGASILWPVIYLVGVQTDALIDQAVLLRAGPGWAGTGALAYSYFSAAVVLVLGPLTNQALAGRVDLHRRRYAIGLPLAVTLGYLGLVPVVLKLVMEGGAVAGGRLDLLIKLGLLYGLAMPFSIYWQALTRARHANDEHWRRLALSALMLLILHAGGLAPVVLFRAWSLVPLATVLSFLLLAFWEYLSSSKNEQRLSFGKRVAKAEVPAKS